MESLPQYQVDTRHGLLKLTCIDIDEPNNGRMLFKVLLALNGEDITERYFGDWNFINFNVNGYKPFSADGEWFYISKETDHFLVRLSDLQKINLPAIQLSAATFIKNFFWNNRLVVLSDDCIIIWDLEMENFIRYNLDSKERRYINISAEQNGLIAVLDDGTQQEIAFTIK